MEYQPPTLPTLNAALMNRLQNKLRLKHLALLQALGEQPTLHIAAEKLHLTQPAATKLLRDIEDVLDTSLFVRHARGLRATDVGEVVIQFSQALIGQVRHFAADIESKKNGFDGCLSFGAIMGAFPDCVSPALALMKQRHPQLTIRLMGDTSDEVMQMLQSNQIEFGVCRHLANEHHAQFRFQPLGNESLVFVASPEHPLSAHKQLKIQDLANETWVLQALPSPTRVLLDRQFSRIDVDRPRKVIECNSMYASLSILKHLTAVSLLSEQVAREDLRSKKISQLPLRLQGALKEYGIVVKRGVTLSQVAKEFIQLLKHCATP